MRKIIIVLVLLIFLQTVMAICAITSFEIEEASNSKYINAASPLTINIDFNGTCDGNVIVNNEDRLSGEGVIEYNSVVTGPNMSITINPATKGIRRFSATFEPNEITPPLVEPGVLADSPMGGIEVPPEEPLPTDIVILSQNLTFILNWERSWSLPMFNEYNDFNITTVFYNRTINPINNIPYELSSTGSDLNIIDSFSGQNDYNLIVDLPGYTAKLIWWYVGAIEENKTLTVTGGTGIDELGNVRDVNSAPIINLVNPQVGDYNLSNVNFDYNVTNQNDVNYCELIIDNEVDQVDLAAPFGTFNKVFDIYGTYNWDVNCVSVDGHDYNVNDGIEFDSNNGSRTINVVAFGGLGTEIDPYLLDTCMEIQSIKNFLDANFVLGFHINCIGSDLWNSGKGFEPIGQDYDSDGSLESNEIFSGTLDGNYYEINALDINRPGENRVGLISYLGSTGVVKRLGLVNTSVSGKMRVGAMIGENYGTVSESYSAGNVYGVYAVGGLVGNNANLVEKSYSNANVNALNAYSWGAYAGGLVGWNLATINNSYATGTINANKQGSAGLVGVNHQTPGFTAIIENSYSIGQVISNQGVGMVENIIGSVSNSYWDTNTSTKISGAGTGKFTNEMMQEATFVGWDFTTIWKITEGLTYPTFQWQN